MGTLEEKELALRAIMEWEERTDRWLSFPPEAREEVVRLLAELMIRVADAEAAEDQDGSDRPEAT